MNMQSQRLVTGRFGITARVVPVISWTATSATPRISFLRECSDNLPEMAGEPWLNRLWLGEFWGEWADPQTVGPNLQWSECPLDIMMTIFPRKCDPGNSHHGSQQQRQANTVLFMKTIYSCVIKSTLNLYIAWYSKYHDQHRSHTVLLTIVNHTWTISLPATLMQPVLTVIMFKISRFRRKANRCSSNSNFPWKSSQGAAAESTSTIELVEIIQEIKSSQTNQL